MRNKRKRPAPAPAPPAAAPAANAGAPAPAPPRNAIQWRRHLLILLGLWIAALLAYSNSFRAGLTFDNGIAIRQDGRIHAATAANVRQIFTEEYYFRTSTNGLYRPLTTLSFLFNFVVLRNHTNPAGYHWVNFALHAIDIALVYCLGLLLLGEISWAGLLAALWALHPLLTESVTNIVGRADELAALGMFAGLLCHVRAGQSAGLRKAAWLAGLAASAAVAVFSKESGVAVVAAMLCYDAAFARSKPWRPRLAGYAAVAIPLAVFFFLRARMLSHIAISPIPFVDNPLADTPPFAAGLTAILVIGKYLWLFLWPAHLSCDYSYNQIPVFGESSGWSDLAAILALAVCLGAAFAAIRAWRCGRESLCFAIAFFFAALAPTANLLIPVGSIMAERWMYPPSFGVALAAVIGLQALQRRLPGVSTRTLMAAAGVVCLAWGARTYFRNFDWRDDRALWQSAARSAPDSYKSYFTLANMLATDPHPSLDLAIQEAERSTAMLDSLGDERNFARPYAVEGMCYRIKGESLSDPQQRQVWYRKALAALERARRIDRAGLEIFNRVNLAHGKGSFETGLALLYLELGRVQHLVGQDREALESLAYGRELTPIEDFSEEESKVFRDQGDRDRQAVALLEGLIIDPQAPHLRDEVVQFYKQTAPLSCAVLTTGKKPLFNPQCPLVHNQLCEAGHNVALTYMKFGKPEEAMEVAHNAVSGLGCPASLF
jgi:tetratricopeptide (TPR) repeat protein